jgi:hypothetical protein
MRARGLGWKKIARELGCGVSTVLRVGQAEEKRGSVMPVESGPWKCPAFSAHLNRSERFGLELIVELNLDPPALDESSPTPPASRGPAAAKSAS